MYFFLGVLFILLLIYGWSGIFYAYVYSFFKKNLVSSMLLFISINFIIGCNLLLFIILLIDIIFMITHYLFTGLFINNALLVMRDIIRVENKINPYNYWNIFRHIVLIIPHFSYSSCIAKFLQITWENNRCKICKTPDVVEACSPG